MLGDNLNQVALHGCTSMAEVISRGREFLAAHNLPAGQTLQGFPYSQMNHYVNKITSCYGAYQRIYAGN